MSETINEVAGKADSDAGDDRRAHKRVDTKVELQGTPEDGGVVARMVTRNLSLGGVYCISSAGFPEMTRLAVRMMLPMPASKDAEPLDLEAVVVRREELANATNGDKRYELALFFPRLDNGTKARLAGFLNS